MIKGMTLYATILTSVSGDKSKF